MKNFTLKAFIILLCISFSAIAQKKQESSQVQLTEENQRHLDDTGFVRCLSTENELILKSKFPNRATDDQFENWMSTKIEQIKQERIANPESRQQMLLTIPVVVHVVHSGQAIGTAPNITDAQVISQITAMNEDFGKLAGTPGDGTGVDVEIQFCLAQQDPNGLATNGIVRFDSSALGATWSGPGGSTDTVLKPATQWDPTKYMNMWSVQFSNPALLGYAQFPDASGLAGLNASNGPANSDGVVAAYSTFGDIGSTDGTFLLNAPYDRGRTMTHEVGHYLGLRHIWGDANCGNDFCADTPIQQTSSGGNCPSTTTCDGVADLTTNYMDYSNDICMNNFTQNQKDRMVTVMMNSPRRMELPSSIGCVPPQVFNLDGGINIDNLNLVDCGTTIAPDVTITNSGSSTLTSATIEYFLDSEVPTPLPWTGSLATGMSETITLPAIDLSAGEHIFNVELTNPNGSTDEQLTNNTDASNSFAAFYDTATITLDLVTDDYGAETSWEFKDSSDTVLYSGTGYANNTAYNDVFTVVVGECYTFTINDSYGDGICCGFGSGSYTLSDDAANVLVTGGQFTTQENVVFGVNNLSVGSYFIESGIGIYPNPSVDVLNIKVPNTNDLPDGYKVFNMLGQTISEKQINNESDLSIATSNYSNGMYFIKISKQGESITLPFIKK